jgi:outer membrane protein
VLVPLWFEASGYLEDGFEFFVRVPVALAHVRVGAMTPDGSGFVPASGLQLGVRYLFLEEAVRPFVFLHLGGVWTFRGASVADNLLVGPGGGVGLEIFVSDSVSLQARAFGEWYVTINAPQRGSLGATVTVSTSFRRAQRPKPDCPAQSTLFAAARLSWSRGTAAGVTSSPGGGSQWKPAPGAGGSGSELGHGGGAFQQMARGPHGGHGAPGPLGSPTSLRGAASSRGAPARVSRASRRASCRASPVRSAQPGSRARGRERLTADPGGGGVERQLHGARPAGPRRDSPRPRLHQGGAEPRRAGTTRDALGRYLVPGA